jgi:hypothetical protein
MKQIYLRRGLFSCLLGLLCAGSFTSAAVALGSQQNPQSGSTGLQGKISQPPPTRGATIDIPGNGQTFTSIPITVSGTCPSDLLVELFSNNIFVGATQCKGGSYTLKIDLFSGKNDLIARVFDSLDQAGPDSNKVSVTYRDATFTQFGHVSLSSKYAKLGADPGTELDWPVILTGGTGPYAVSTDWGDGTSPTLQSVQFTGEFIIKHTYKTAGVYNVIVRATDKNGTTAFLQLVGVANGKVSQSTTTNGNATIILKKELVLWPFLIIFPLIVSTFWLGRRYELLVLRRRIERQTEKYGSETKAPAPKK